MTLPFVEGLSIINKGFEKKEEERLWQLYLLKGFIASNQQQPLESYNEFKDKAYNIGSKSEQSYEEIEEAAVMVASTFKRKKVNNGNI